MKKFILLVCLLLSISLLTACNFEFSIGDLDKDDDQDIQIDDGLDWENDWTWDDDFDAEDDWTWDDDLDNEDDWTWDDDLDNDDDWNNDFNDEPVEDEKESKPNAKSFADLARKGDATNPIKQNEAGIVTRNNTYDTIDNESNLYIRVKETLSTSKAKQLVDKHNETAYVTYTLGDSTEWRGAIIEVDLKDFQTHEKYGTSLGYLLSSIYIQGPDGDDLQYNGYKYFLLSGRDLGPVDESIENVFQGDVIELYIVYPLPIGYDGDYIIEFSNKNYSEKTCFLIEQ